MSNDNATKNAGHAIFADHFVNHTRRQLMKATLISTTQSRRSTIAKSPYIAKGNNAKLKHFQLTFLKHEAHTPTKKKGIPNDVKCPNR